MGVPPTVVPCGGWTERIFTVGPLPTTETPAGEVGRMLQVSGGTGGGLGWGIGVGANVGFGLNSSIGASPEGAPPPKIRFRTKRVMTLLTRLKPARAN